MARCSSARPLASRSSVCCSDVGYSRALTQGSARYGMGGTGDIAGSGPAAGLWLPGRPGARALRYPRAVHGRPSGVRALLAHTEQHHRDAGAAPAFALDLRPLLAAALHGADSRGLSGGQSALLPRLCARSGAAQPRLRTQRVANRSADGGRLGWSDQVAPDLIVAPSAVLRSRQRAYRLSAKAIDRVIVDDAARLHPGVHDDGSDELESPPFERLRQFH